MCRQETPFPQKDALPFNTPLIELMERLLLEEKEAHPDSRIDTIASLLAHTVWCGICAKLPATVYCYDCPERLCQEFCDACSVAEHAAGLVSKHTRVPIAERPEKEVKCPVHPAQNLVLYCKKDKVRPFSLQCSCRGLISYACLALFPSPSFSSRK